MAKPRLLLHICCGPCAVWPVTNLLAQDYDLTGLFYNPNIHPYQEYLLRRQAVTQMAAHFQLPVIHKDEPPQTYLRAVTFRENNRCYHCYFLRLEKTWHIARHGRFDFFSTTMLYSKQQKHQTIAAIGQDLASGSGPRFLYQDFRTGWTQGINMSKDLGLYRQTWCGCLYSNFERFGIRPEAG